MECVDIETNGSYRGEKEAQLEVDCKEEFGTSCIEFGKNDGACVMHEGNCSKGRLGTCSDSREWLAGCAKEGVAFYAQPCDVEGSFCEESENGGAYCVLLEGSCEPGEGRCSFHDGSDSYIECNKDTKLWSSIRGCEEDTFCDEWIDEDGMTKAGCFVSSEPCSEGAKTICVGKILADCQGSGYPELLEKCWADYCLQSEIDPSISACAYDPEPCRTGNTKCKKEFVPEFERYMYSIMTCIDGLWSKIEGCANEGICIQVGSGKAECQDTSR